MPLVGLGNWIGRSAAHPADPLGELFHQFGEAGGVTGAVVLAESHLAIHTWPEKRYVTLDVYVCNYSQDNRGKAQALFDQLVAVFDPELPRTQCVERE
ncbi:MAG: S-adenosylmethionine decarboxylase family protein [Thermosynechococcus sp.]